MANQLDAGQEDEEDYESFGEAPEDFEEDSSVTGAVGEPKTQRKSDGELDAEDALSSWEASTCGYLEAARALKKDVDRSKRSQMESRMLSTHSGSAVQESLRLRVDDTSQRIRSLVHHVERTGQATQAVGNHISLLQRAWHDKTVPLRVVEHRLALREGRPPSENVQDSLHVSLVLEHRCLYDARARLAERALEGQALFRELEAHKPTLVAELQHAKRVLRLDRSGQLFEGFHCPWAVLPRLAQEKRRQLRGDHRPTVSQSEDGEPEDVRRPESPVRDLFARTKELEAKVASFQQRGNLDLTESKRECERVMQRSKEDLRRRVREAYQLKNQLSKEVVDVGQLITDTELKIRHIHGQLNDDTGAVAVWVESREAEFVSEAERLDFVTTDALRKARHAAGDRTQFWGLRSAEALLAPQVQVISDGLQRIADELLSANVDDSRALRQLATTLEARLASTESELDGLRKSIAAKRLGLEDEQRRAQDGVAQLSHSRAQLSQDLTMKTASWNVDFTCSNLNRCQFEDKEQTSAPSAPQKPWKPREPPPKPLEESTLNQLRLKVKSAAYTGHAGMELDMIFRRFDKDGSGQLDVDEVRQALRRSLKVPPSLISDLEIKSLCKQLDADQSGAVSVEEIVDFLASGPQQTPRKRRAQAHVLAPLTSVSKAVMVTTREGPPRPMQSWQSLPPKTSRRPLSKDELDQVRQKIKAAAYAGHLGRQLEETFAQFDTDGSGQLEDEEVKRALRRTLRLPKSEVSDEQVAALCAALDADNSGAVSIQELVDFIGQEPEISQRTGKKVRALVLLEAFPSPGTSGWSLLTPSAGRSVMSAR